MTPIEIVLAAALVFVLGLVTYLSLRSHRSGPAPSGSVEAEVRLQPTCSTCRSFDLEEGQAAIARYPAALVAYQHISPAEQAETNHSLVPLKAKWTEMGACSKHNLCVWGGEGAKERMRQLEDLVTADITLDQLKERIERGRLTILNPTGKDCWEARS